MMTTHELKTWPVAFELTLAGAKMFEIRVNDRNFQVGDTLHLREWDHYNGEYTGRDLWCEVTCVVTGWGMPDGVCALGIAAHRAPADATQETSISAFEENMRRDKFDAGGGGLRDAAQAIADDVCSMLCPSVKKTGTEWTHVEKCINLRAALAATPPARDAEMRAVVDAAQLEQLSKLESFLHSQRLHPDYEYTTTDGPRKNFDALPPYGEEGWERNTHVGREGWERFEYHEEAYWMRKRDAVDALRRVQEGK